MSPARSGQLSHQQGDFFRESGESFGGVVSGIKGSVIDLEYEKEGADLDRSAPEDEDHVVGTTSRGEGRPATTGMSHATKRRRRSMGHGYSNLRYMCPFERVLSLVRSRQVILRGGQALLAPWQVPVVFVEHFEKLLREGLGVAERALPGVEQDERVRGLLGEVMPAQLLNFRSDEMGAAGPPRRRRVSWLRSESPRDTPLHNVWFHTGSRGMPKISRADSVVVPPST